MGFFHVFLQPTFSFPLSSFSVCLFVSISVCLSLFSFLLLLKFSDDFVHDERDYVDFNFNFRGVFILKIIPSLVSLCVLKAIPSQTPEGRPGMSHVCPLFGISGLSLDSSFLCLFVFLLLFLSCYFFLLLVMVYSPDFFFPPENCLTIVVKSWAFLYGSWLAGGMCSLLPCGTGI